MAAVVDLGRWRRERRREERPCARLEGAVERLDRALARRGWNRRAPGWVVTELLAIQGAVSLELPEEAADRADGLASRLEGRMARR